MKLRLLADSSYYIAVLRARTDPFLRFKQHYPDHDLVTCGMVMLEVLPGITGPRLLEYTRKKFAQVTCAPTLASTWELAQEMTRKLRQIGRPIQPQDIIIAACAQEAGASVLTRDNHFLQIKGLNVVMPGGEDT